MSERRPRAGFDSVKVENRKRARSDRGAQSDHRRRHDDLPRRDRKGRGGSMSANSDGGRVLPMLAIYADESCLGNGREGNNPGAAGSVIEYVNAATGNLTRWDLWISEPATTNNRMALRSAIESLRGISRKGVRFRVTFTSDSQYLVKGMS